MTDSRTATLTLRRRLAGKVGVYLLANVLNASVPFFLLPVLTRVLTPVDYGTVAMFALTLSVLGAFTGLSVQGAVAVRYYQLGREGLAEYVGACVAILMASSAIVLLVVATAGPWLSDLTGIPVAWLLLAVVISGLQFLVNIRLALWVAATQAKEYGGLQVSQSLLNAALSLVLVLVAGMAWQGRVLGQVIAIITVALVALASLRRDRLVRAPRQWRKPVADALGFGIPLIPHVIGGLLIVTSDRVIISRELGIAHVGVYIVALQIGQGLGLVTESVNKAYAPWLMGRLSGQETFDPIFVVRSTYLYFVGLVIAALAIGYVAPPLMDVVVGSSFRPAGALVIYIALGFAFGGCYYMVTNYVFFESRTASLAAIVVSAGVVNVGLTYILVRHHGITGAAQSFMAAQLLTFLGTWALAQRVHPMPWLRALRRGTRG